MHEQVQEAIVLIDDDQLVNQFFDGARQLIDALALSAEDKRLAFTAPQGTARLTVNLNRRFVYSLHMVEERREWFFMLSLDDLYEFVDSYPLKQSGDPFSGTDLMVLCFVETEQISRKEWQVLMDRCIKRCKEYLPSRSGSPYRNKHMPELYSMAVDENYRKKAMDKILEEAGANLSPQDELIRRYVERVAQDGNKEELYKWELLGKKHWNLDAPDMVKMVKAIPFRNLVYPMGVAVLYRLAELFPEQLRGLLKMLFGKERSLQERISVFSAETLKLYRQDEPKLSHHQDERTIASYLAFYDPEIYPLYKSSFYKKYCDLLSSRVEKSGRRYVHYTALLQEFIANHLRPDEEAVRYVKSLLPTGAFRDNNLLLMAQDILYTTLDYAQPDVVEEEKESEEDVQQIKREQGHLHPLNTILYGPPGTGKTYHTASLALQLAKGLDDKDVDELDRDAVLAEVDILKDAGRIEFTTFHQSLSYEDFIEGIKPETTPSGAINYKTRPGMLMRIAYRALYNLYEGLLPRQPSGDFATAYHAFVKDLQERAKTTRELFTSKEGHLLLLDEVTSDESFVVKYKWANSATKAAPGAMPFRVRMPKVQAMFEAGVPKVVKNLHTEVWPIVRYNGSVYYAVYKAFLDFAEKNYPGLKAGSIQSGEDDDLPNEIRNCEDYEVLLNRVYDLMGTVSGTLDYVGYVLIIDEVNRGNVSQVFGELITLVEEDKRVGEAERLDAILPYSQTHFALPLNLYLIGTMNTADRSVEALDTALRRRFTFEHMPPKPDLLSTAGTINLQQLLTTINDRLTILLDADRTIGHAWLMGIQSEEELTSAFQHKILPLLGEYFYNDLGKIGLVLGPSFVEATTVDDKKFAPFPKAKEIAEAYRGTIQYQLKDPATWDFQSIYNSDVQAPQTGQG